MNSHSGTNDNSTTATTTGGAATTDMNTLILEVRAQSGAEDEG